MSSFLHLLAKDLLLKRGNDFDRLTIVFPNKRAGLFLARELASLIDRPVWMPEILTLGEFIERGTKIKQADDLALVIKLYTSYKESSGSDESFEDFYFWGNMLLGDFDDIDKYLADAKDIFSNLTALKEIEHRFSYLTKEQADVIREFWSTFKETGFSPEQHAFLQTWQSLYPTYRHYKQKLLMEGICYEGMGQRMYCERLHEAPIDQPVVFAGFNALNRCEEKIFSHFKEYGDALFYWDYDLYYSSNDHHEAGHYIRKNLKRFPNALGPEHFNSFSYNNKTIDYIALPSVVGQAKLLPELLREMSSKTTGDYSDTAVVLCDETLLTPVLHSLPPDIDKINITMGYPARHTAIAALISLIGDLVHYAKKENGTTYYYHKNLTAVLNHPLVLESAPEEIRKLTEDIQAYNSIYVSEKKVGFNEITRAIFSPATEDTVSYLLDILKKILASLSEDKDDNTTLEKEVLFILFTRIQQIRNHFEEEGIVPETRLYIRMIGKIIQGLSIPFSGEPLEGMQVMGLMETRMLDFKKLILLSVNEGIIPKNSTAASFIPYNLRKGFDLPTPEHRDALFAYYFYRLLQRSEAVKLIYSDAAQGLNSGEMSRFLFQMKYESGLPIRERHVQNEITTQEIPSIEIPKNEEIIRLLERYTLENERGLSPSALNTYMDCRLKFYFRYIARIREKEELAEELDHRLLGTIFHETIQTLYESLPEKRITDKRIDSLLGNQLLIDRHIRKAYNKVYDTDISGMMEGGANDLVLSVIRKYIRKVLEYDRSLTPFELIATEETYRFALEIPTSRGILPVYIEGNIDRVDKLETGTRVIDYKTGADKSDFKNLESIFDPLNKTRNKAAFQTLLYCMMYAAGHPEADPLMPGIYSTKLLFAPDYSYLLYCEKEAVTRFTPYEPEFRELLTTLLQDIFSPDVPFDQTPLTEKCKNCPYNEICKRS